MEKFNLPKAFNLNAYRNSSQKKKFAKASQQTLNKHEDIKRERV